MVDELLEKCRETRLSLCEVAVLEVALEEAVVKKRKAVC